MDQPNQDPTRSLISEATPWIDAKLAEAGISRVGHVQEPRVRTWATVIPVPTNRGTVWFKAASRPTAHEIGLYTLLVREAPELVLHPIATDLQLGWMLLPDGGPSLLHAVAGDDLVRRLLVIVPHYAKLQRAMSRHVPSMLEIGTPDRRPDILPDRFDEALAATERLAEAAGADVDLEALRQVREMRPRFLAWTEALAASPVPLSIDHSDLHANNILVPEGPEGLGRIYDWGDAVIAHPFSTLCVMLRALMDRLETGPDDPRLARVRSAYLEPFSDLAVYAHLVELADAACWTSIVIRALTWLQVLELGPPADPEWANAPVEWMKTFLSRSWLE